ncbi:hypothetical protein BDR07DRAFT_1383813 [Suillus spraguei]|nr:hypothetical protein BDR07DRAFT_1383813 [Suillus spraguei]
MLLFGINWMLCHVHHWHVILARRLVDIKSMTKHLVSAFAILLVIPQLRNSMPDSPGFDDSALIGVLSPTSRLLHWFHPQMIISALCVLAILLLVMVREYDEMESKQPPRQITVQPFQRPPHYTIPRCFPYPCTSYSTPEITKHLRAEVRTRSIAMELGEATRLKDELDVTSDQNVLVKRTSQSLYRD